MFFLIGSEYRVVDGVSFPNACMRGCLLIAVVHTKLLILSPKLSLELAMQLTTLAIASDCSDHAYRITYTWNMVVDYELICYHPFNQPLIS